MIEIERSLDPKPARGFYRACEVLEPDRRFVVYAGADRFPIAPGVEAVSLRELAGELAGLA